MKYVVFRWGRGYQVRPLKGEYRHGIPGGQERREGHYYRLDTGTMPTSVAASNVLVELDLEDDDEVQLALLACEAKAKKRVEEVCRLQEALQQVEREVEEELVALLESTF